MNHYLSHEEVSFFTKLAEKSKNIKDLIDELELQVMNSELSNGEKLAIFEWITNRSDGLKSLPYFMTPQREWIGGDSSKESNYKFTKPHILKMSDYINSGEVL